MRYDDSDRSSPDREWDVKGRVNTHPPSDLLIELGIVEHRVDPLASAPNENATRLRSTEFQVHSDKPIRIGAFSVRCRDPQPIGAARLVTIPGMGHALPAAVVPRLTEEILAHTAVADAGS